MTNLSLNTLYLNNLIRKPDRASSFLCITFKEFNITDRELVSAPLTTFSEFQSKLGARTMLRFEAVMRF